MNDGAARNRNQNDFNGQVHKRNENEGMKWSSSIHTYVAESGQPAQRGQIDSTALAQQHEAFENHGDQAPNPIMFANVGEIVKKSLFPIISQRVLARKIQNNDHRWNYPSSYQGKEIRQWRLSLGNSNGQ